MYNLKQMARKLHSLAVKYNAYRMPVQTVSHIPGMSVYCQPDIDLRRIPKDELHRIGLIKED